MGIHVTEAHTPSKY